MMRFREGQRVALNHTVRPQLDLSVLSAVHFHHGLLDTVDAAALEEFPVSQEAAGNVQSGGPGWGGPQSPIGRHSPSLFCPRRSNSWWSCCGRSFSSSSWWPFAIPTPHSSSMNVSPQASRALGLGLAVVTLCTGAPVRTRSTDRTLK